MEQPADVDPAVPDQPDKGLAAAGAAASEAAVAPAGDALLPDESAENESESSRAAGDVLAAQAPPLQTAPDVAVPQDPTATPAEAAAAGAAAQPAQTSAGDAGPGDVKADNVAIAHKIDSVTFNHYRAEIASSVRVDRVSVEELRHVRAVFVEPPDYARFQAGTHVSAAIAAPVTVVYGRASAGRSCCALRLALEAWGGRDGAPRVLRHRRLALDVVPLVEHLRHEVFEKEAIYVVEQADGDSASFVRALSGADLVALSHVLLEKQSRLIISASLTRDEVECLTTARLCADLDATSLGLVYERHLVAACARHARQEWGQVKWGELRELLTTPGCIRRYFELFLLEPADCADAREIARRAALLDSASAQIWFEALGPADKLYALVLGLFEGLDLNAMEGLYTRAADGLRRAGMRGLSDWHLVGRRRRFLNLRVRVKGGCPSFDDPRLAAELTQQLYDRSALAWLIVNAGVGQLDEALRDGNWPLLRAVGQALGRVGAHDWRRFETVIRDLACHRSAKIAMLAGDALEETCRLAPGDALQAVRLVQKWADSGDPHLKWASGAAAWRLLRCFGADTSDESRKLSQRTLDALTALAHNVGAFNHGAVNSAMVATRSDVGAMRQLGAWRTANQDSAVFAACALWWQSPETGATLLASWLKGPSKPLRDAGRSTAQYLFRDAKLGAGQPPGRSQLGLLDLLPHLLAADAEDDVLPGVLEPLATWASTHQGRQALLRCLMDLAGRHAFERGSLLRERLCQSWIQHESAEVRDIARAIIRRSYVMSGQPMEAPGARALLVVDASSAAARDRRCASLAEPIWAELACQVRTTLIALGGRGAFGPQDPFFAEARLQAPFARARLLAPLLETNIDQASYAVVIAWGPIADIVDVSGAPYAQRVLFVAPDTLEMGHRLKSARLRLSAGEINPTVASRQLRDLRSEVLLESGQAFTAPPSFEAERADEWLEERLAQFGAAPPEGTALDSMLDPAWETVQALLSLCEADPKSGIARLHLWITSEPDRPEKRAVGIAASVALFRLHARQLPSVLGAWLEGLLPLAYLLDADWPTCEPVIQALHAWWSERAWVSGDVRPGEAAAWWRWMELQIRHFPNQLEDLTEVWAVSPPASTAALSWTERFRERIRVRLTLGAVAAKNGSEHRRRGLIVLDAAARGKGLSKVASTGAALVKALSQSCGKRGPLAVHRLGQRAPMDWLDEPVPPGGAWRLDILPWTLPRLLAPVLEDYKPDSTDFVLVVTGGVPLDEEDVPASWNACLWFYDPTGTALPRSSRRGQRVPYEKPLNDLVLELQAIRG